MSKTPPCSDLDDLIARFAAAEGVPELPPPIAQFGTLEALVALAASSGEDELGNTIASFRDSCNERIEELRQGLAEARTEAVGAAAHFIAGGAGALGARHLEELCRRLAQRARTGSLDGGAAMLRDLETEARRVVDALERFRRQHGAHEPKVT